MGYFQCRVKEGAFVDYFLAPRPLLFNINGHLPHDDTRVPLSICSQENNTRKRDKQRKELSVLRAAFFYVDGVWVCVNAMY